MSRQRALDKIAYGLLGLVWGSNFLSMKLAVQVITPAQVALLRVLFGAIPIVAFGLARKSLRFSHLKFSHHFLATAILSTVVPYIGFLKGTQYLSSGPAGAIAGIIPLFTAVLSAVLLPGDRFTMKQLTGLLVGFMGVACISQITQVFDLTSSFSSSSHANHSFYGASFMLIGSVGYASGMVYVRKFISPLRISSVALACYQVAFASILLGVFVPTQGIGAVLEHPFILMALAVGLGLLGTGLAFILYYHLIERLGVVTASSVFYVPPVVALIVGAVFAHETLLFSQYVGGALILLGVYLARHVPKEPAQVNATMKTT